MVHNIPRPVFSLKKSCPSILLSLLAKRISTTPPTIRVWLRGIDLCCSTDSTCGGAGRGTGDGGDCASVSFSFSDIIRSKSPWASHQLRSFLPSYVISFLRPGTFCQFHTM